MPPVPSNGRISKGSLFILTDSIVTPVSSVRGVINFVVCSNTEASM